MGDWTDSLCHYQRHPRGKLGLADGSAGDSVSSVMELSSAMKQTRHVPEKQLIILSSILTGLGSGDCGNARKGRDSVREGESCRNKGLGLTPDPRHASDPACPRLPAVQLLWQ